ncbi:helix-turn-helix transcriptional regulator [Hymenobacter volaticus]|uniref:WYL domain-containing protein n=1 Tax=Hymenobacter volaticus TaxID=2932254 RepID=A0ABY4GGQ3_9BACT|nr:WYL domain-containing protein [Hymenobacter volaticus]UOQ69474.1 WYL domain-containing protein [Hymenobacter volaticus]
MPVNKSAHDRYLIIDKCLQRRNRTWTIKDLLAAVEDEYREAGGDGVCERTLKGDLHHMKKLNGYNAPIKYSRRLGYHYTKPGFSIRNTPLTSADLLILHQSLHPLKALRGLGLADELNELIRRLEQHLPNSDEAAGPVLQLEAAPEYTGTEHLKRLYKAISEKTPLRIEYQPYRAPKARAEEVHPYLLKTFNGRWYLIAQNDAKGDQLQNYALDRIKDIDDSQIVFRPATVDFGAYFTSLIGVTIPQTSSCIETVRLRMSSGRAPYVLTKAIHPSQVVLSDTKAGLEIELRLIINQELKTNLLSYGPDLQVLAPDSLRHSLRKLLKKALTNYQ